MIGTIVNAVTIILGALMGTFLKGSFSDDIKDTLMHGLSLTIMIIGISMGIKTENLLVLTLSIVSGGILGELLKIEDRLAQWGKGLEARFSEGDGDFTQAFVSASLIYCVGAMAILGAIESGLEGRHSILFVKSILDGVSAVVFSSSLGIGVAFAALPVFVYQGSITLGAVFVKAFLSQAIISEMTATGGILIFAIGINMLGIDIKIKIGNLLPAILMSIVFTLFLADLVL